MKHGRLIDADALKKDINECIEIKDDNCEWEQSEGLKVAIRCVDEQPTIEPEQKVEGLLPDGTLHLFTDTDLSKVNRVLVSQNGTHYGDLYYTDGERKTGKWDFIGDNMFACSGCGTPYTLRQLSNLKVRTADSDFPKFCPNCGTDMRGDEDG